MQKLVFRNANGIELDLTTDPFGITEWEGFSADELNIQSQQVPFQDGGVFLDALLNERTLSVTVAMNDKNNLETRYRLRREMISKLNPKLGEGVLIYTNDYLSKQIHCIPQMPIFQNKNSNDSGTPKVSCSFTACNPYWEDLEDIEVDIFVDEIKEIQNDGDVPVPVDIDLIISDEVENPEVENITLGKKIKCLGDFDKYIEINTNIGNKSIIELTGDIKDFYQTKIFMLTNCITYNETLNTYFVGAYAASCGLIFKSKDLKKWQVSLSIKGSGKNPAACGYSNILHKTVFITASGDFLSTSDGINWTSVNTGADGGPSSPNGICEISNKIIVGSSRNQIAISSDGINWTVKTISGYNGNINSLAYASDLGIIVAVGFAYSGGQDILGILTSSDDGETWVNRSSSTLGYGSFSVCYSAHLHLFVISDDSSGKAITSSDGINWTKNSDSTVGKIVKWIDEKRYFISVGYNFVFFSTDGINWNRIATGYSGNTNDIIFVENEFIIAGDRMILKSTDLIRWIQLIDVSDSGYVFKNTCYSKTLDLFLITYDDEFFRSKDGINWELFETSISGSDVRRINKIFYSDIFNIFIAITSNGVILTSSDGINWTSQVSGVSTSLNDIIYCNKLNLFIIVGNSGVILTSSDGINWTSQVSGVSTSLNGVCTNEESTVIIVGDSGVMLKSGDGSSWSSITSGTNTKLNKIAFSKILGLYGTFIVVGNNGLILKTNNANYSNWESISTEITDNIISIFFNEYEQTFYIGYGNDAPGGGVSISKDGDLWEKVKALSGGAGYTFSVSSKSKIKIVGQPWMLSYSELTEKENIINRMSDDSNIGFDLDVGENKIVLNKTSGGFYIKLKYRQKYIGV